jgi:hypothetical protein
MIVLEEASDHTEHPFKERRAGYVTMSREFLDELEAHIKEENNLFSSLRLAAGVFAALIAVLTWVFIEKNSDIKAMQATLNSHSIAIAETLVILKQQMNEHDRLMSKTDK